MVHGDDDVIGAAHGFDEDGVGRNRALHVVAFLLHRLDGRDDLVGFFMAEEAVFTAVRVEAGDGDARMFVAEELHGVVGEADDFFDARFLDAVAGFAQRDVRRDVDDAELAICADAAREEHGVLRRVRVLGEDFRVAAVVVAGHVEGFFVDGRGDDGVDLSREREGDAFFNILEADVAAERGDLLVFPAAGLQEVHVDVVDRAVFALCFRWVLDFMQLQVEVAKAHSIFEGGLVADDDGDGRVVDVSLVQRLDADLRADAGGVAHGDGETFASFLRVVRFHSEVTVLDFLADLGRRDAFRVGHVDDIDAELAKFFLEVVPALRAFPVIADEDGVEVIELPELELVAEAVDDGAVDAADGGEDAAAAFFVDDGAAVLVAFDDVVAVDADDEVVALALRGLDHVEVAGVEEVEHAVGVADLIFLCHLARFFRQRIWVHRTIGAAKWDAPCACFLAAGSYSRRISR